MAQKRFTRRDFLKTAGTLLAMTAAGSLPSTLFAGERKLVRFPEKTDLILLTQRPPQLETPLHFFKELINPKDVLFVRWHISRVPTSIELNQWRLSISGNVEKELRLSMDDLRKFEKVSYTAVIQCSGNSRSFFEPRVAKPFKGFLVKSAYRIPDTPCGCVVPGSPPGKTVPVLWVHK